MRGTAVLRPLIVALLLANLLFYGWTQGWLDGIVGTRANSDREPDRLQRQLRPEIVRILAPGAKAEVAATTATPSTASPAAPPADSSASPPEPAASRPVALACLEAGPFNTSQASAAQKLAEAALPSGSWVSAKVDVPGSYIVYMGKFPDHEALVKKAEELKRRKLTYIEIDGNGSLAPGLQLGKFGDRASATKALDEFAQQGIHTARVVELKAVSTSQWLRIAQADETVAAKAAALRGAALGKGFAPCVDASSAAASAARVN